MKIAQRVATGYMKKQGGEWGSFVKVASNEVIEDYIRSFLVQVGIEILKPLKIEFSNETDYNNLGIVKFSFRSRFMLYLSIEPDGKVEVSVYDVFSRTELVAKEYPFSAISGRYPFDVARILEKPVFKYLVEK